MDCRVKPGNDGERYESQILYYELYHLMIRVIFYLILVAVLAFGAVWMADRPGEVAITWQGTRIDTSVLVLMAAVAAVAAAAVIVWSILRAIVRAPETIARYRRYRRGVRGYLAVSQGLIAVGSGDARAAKRFTADAVRIAPREPLTLLLSAQNAQLSGDHDTAVATFQNMASRDDTRVLGLHGLFVEAQRRADHAAALTYAEEAARHASVPVWAAQAVLEFRCVAGDWSGALDRLDRNLKSRLIDRRTYRRQRAVLLTAQAIAQTDRERATALAREAAKLAPDLVPAAALAARLLGEAGERRKAGRILERAWHVNPHPDLADAYVKLRPGDSARQRLSRVEALAAKGPADAEAALAVARAALDAKEFAAARTALAPYTAAPRKRVAALMAELEMAQGDEGRAREWMARALNARRDPAWTADAFVSDHWLPISPVSGRLDAFEWKDPLAGEDHGTVIEHRAEVPAVPARVETPQAGPAPQAEPSQQAPHALPANGERERARPADEPEFRPPGAEEEQRAGEEDSRSPFFAGGRRGRRVRAAAMANEPRTARADMTPIVPAVIPLVHAPDDPGPNGEPPAEPEPPPPASWSRIRALFKS
ncbi:MAG TPA: heme biosynthesis HemY N-terminal domain-containing protein [Xanthobacteraceae bacterium]|jgi:HemY protein|nr:heme biosynthesis HemY N-terminal domain-containing protein [Xanthobacteraceae bacterium]